jgi:hypothetical protein
MSWKLNCQPPAKTLRGATGAPPLFSGEGPTLMRSHRASPGTDSVFLFFHYAQSPWISVIKPTLCPKTRVPYTRRGDSFSFCILCSDRPGAIGGHAQPVTDCAREGTDGDRGFRMEDNRPL